MPEDQYMVFLSFNPNGQHQKVIIINPKFLTFICPIDIYICKLTNIEPYPGMYPDFTGKISSQADNLVDLLIRPSQSVALLPIQSEKTPIFKGPQK